MKTLPGRHQSSLINRDELNSQFYFHTLSVQRLPFIFHRMFISVDCESFPFSSCSTVSDEKPFSRENILQRSSQKNIIIPAILCTITECIMLHEKYLLLSFVWLLSVVNGNPEGEKA